MANPSTQFKKGEPRPKNSGRKPGSKNKIPNDFRKGAQMILDEKIPDYLAWVEKTARRSPFKASIMLTKLAEFIQPKPARIDPKTGETMIPVIQVVLPDNGRGKG